MRLRLSARAKDDIADIGRYIRPRSPRGALTVRAELRSALRLIADHPEIGRRVGRDLHRLAVPRVPYLIFYRVDPAAGEIQVVTIRHGARDPASMPDREVP